MEGSDLAQFREEWLAEIQRQQQNTRHTTVTPNVVQGLDMTHVQAAKIYLEATDCEERGDINSAIRKYREAFKLAPDLTDKQVHEVAQRIHIVSARGNKPRNDQSKSTRDGEASSSTDGLAHASTSAPKHQPVAQHQKPQNLTQDICGDRPVVFRGKDDIWENVPIEMANPNQKGPFLGALAPELLRKIMHLLDPVSLDLCGSTCVGLHVLSRDPKLWQTLCENVWGTETTAENSNENSLNESNALESNPNPENLSRFSFSWRKMYVSRPHLKMDGVYVSCGSYVRSGLGDWGKANDPVFLCKYYRYLRFFPNNTVQGVTTTLEPAAFIPKHRRSLHSAQTCLHGQYQLNDTQLVVVLYNPEQRTSVCFRLLISKVRNRHCLRWQSLSLATVDAENKYFFFDNRQGGNTRPEEIPVSLNSDRPYFFVRT